MGPEDCFLQQLHCIVRRLLLFPPKKLADATAAGEDGGLAAEVPVLTQALILVRHKTRKGSRRDTGRVMSAIEAE